MPNIVTIIVRQIVLFSLWYIPVSDAKALITESYLVQWNTADADVIHSSKKVTENYRRFYKMNLIYNFMKTLRKNHWAVMHAKVWHIGLLSMEVVNYKKFVAQYGNVWI